MPNPPSFNKTPAKTIEPPTGASTWALGSHKCTPYIGNLIKNAKINLILVSLSQLLKPRNFKNWGKLVILEAGSFIKKRIIKKRGNEPRIVYKNIALAACKRSGWYPQPIIIKKIGINEASNKKYKERKNFEKNVKTKIKPISPNNCLTKLGFFFILLIANHLEADTTSVRKTNQNVKES